MSKTNGFFFSNFLADDNNIKGVKRDSYGSHYSMDSMCTVGSSSGGIARDENICPHQLNSSASDPIVHGNHF